MNNRFTQVYAYNPNGTLVGGYPVDAASGPGMSIFDYPSPIIGIVEGSADVLIGGQDALVHAWDNFGNVIGGWPKNVFDWVDLTSAMGDIDNDGSTELVVLTGSIFNKAPTEGQLFVIDLNTPPSPAIATWPMFANNPQRTSCFLCTEDLATSADPLQAAASRVSFAAPSPNPTSAQTVFQFTLPSPAHASLVVYDVRGRRVKMVLQQELSAGEHVFAWNGRDERGTEVATGTYFARLKIEGLDADQSMTQKVTVVR